MKTETSDVCTEPRSRVTKRRGGLTNEGSGPTAWTPTLTNRTSTPTNVALWLTDSSQHSPVVGMTVLK